MPNLLIESCRITFLCTILILRVQVSYCSLFAKSTKWGLQRPHHHHPHPSLQLSSFLVFHPPLDPCLPPSLSPSAWPCHSLCVWHGFGPVGISIGVICAHPPIFTLIFIFLRWRKRFHEIVRNMDCCWKAFTKCRHCLLLFGGGDSFCFHTDGTSASSKVHFKFPSEQLRVKCLFYFHFTSVQVRFRLKIHSTSLQLQQDFTSIPFRVQFDVTSASTTSISLRCHFDSMLVPLRFHVAFALVPSWVHLAPVWEHLCSTPSSFRCHVDAFASIALR